MNYFSLKIFEFLNSPDTLIFGVFLLSISFGITYRMIPVIIATVVFKNLHVHPNLRSSHLNQTPTLGGVAFFGSLMISLFFTHYVDKMGIGYYIVAATTILFFMGLKDDLMVLTSKAKVILQSGAIFFLLLNQDLWLINFHGFLGLYEIPYLISFPLTFFIVLYIINSYNLIDGIDGLAGMLGITISVFYAFLFYFSGLDYYFYISVVIIGYLIAFLRYNLSDDQKIFMGDTGSMITGLLLAFLTLRFLSLNDKQLVNINIKPENIFIVALAILFFPAIDVLRVIVMRLINKRGPFSADRRHLHHIFIDKGLNHKMASITVSISSMLVFGLIYGTNHLFSATGLLFLFLVLSVLTFYILLLLDKDPSTKVRRKKVKSLIPRWLYEIEFRIRKSIIVFLKKIFYKNLL